MIRYYKVERPISQWMELEKLAQKKLPEISSFHQELISSEG
jgi:hypothetical protein